MKISTRYLKHVIREELSNLGEDEGFDRASATTQGEAKDAIIDNTPLGTQDTLDLVYDLIQLIEDPESSERDGHQLVVNFFGAEQD